jgi:protein TonB
MDNNMVLNTGFNELVFENRHKKYGAYQIRRRYRRNVILSGLISISILCSGMVLYFLNLPEATAAVPRFTNRDINLSRLVPPTVDPPKPPTKPVQPKSPPPLGTTSKMITTPKIVEKPVETPSVDSSGKSATGKIGGIGSPIDTTSGGCINCVTKKDSIIPPQRVDWTPDPIKEPGLDAFFKKNIRYPEIAKEQGIQGVVYLEFIVDVLGNTKECKIVKSPDPLLSKEVLRVAAKMPKFEPVTFNGVPVEYIFRKPIHFTLGE